MKHLPYQSLFVKQNILIRTAVMFFGSLAAIAIPNKAMIYFILLTFIYLSVSVELFKHLFSGIRVILPFLAAYSLFAAILGLDIITVLIMIIRLSMLMVLMSYFSASMNLHRFMEDIQACKDRGIITTLLYFLLATLLYLKKLTVYYDRMKNNKDSVEKKINPISGMMNAIIQNWQDKDQVQAETDSLLVLQYQHPPFLTAANIWGCIYITLMILILSV